MNMSESTREYFDPDLPMVGEIRRRYKNPTDLRDYKGLTDGNVAEAILDGAKYGLIIPDIPGQYQLWDTTATVNVHGRRLPVNTALRFKRYGPEADLTGHSTTQARIKEAGLTPKKAFRDVLGDGELRERLLYGAFRGVGWYNPKTKQHNIVSFDVFAEAEFFRRFCGSGIKFNHIFVDTHVNIPSAGGERSHIATLRVFPVTPDNGDFLVEWLMTEAHCDCRDQYQRGATGRAAAKEDEFAKVFKYANPEQVWCKHTLATLHAAEEISHSDAGVPDFLVSYPHATGLLDPFYTLKTKTLIATPKGLRRPRKVDIGVLLGKTTGFDGTENMFGLGV